MPVFSPLRGLAARSRAVPGIVKRLIGNVARSARRFADHVGSSKLIVSDAYGAEYGPAGHGDERASGDGHGGAGQPLPAGASFAGRADLEELPRFLSRSARLARSRPSISAAERLASLGAYSSATARAEIQQLSSRALFLSAVAAIFSAAAFSIWLGNFGRNGSAIARNPRADAIAETFARDACGGKLCTGTLATGAAKFAGPAPYNGLSDTEARMAFVPRFATLYGTAALSLIDTLPAKIAEVKDEPAVAAVDAPAKPGFIRIANLPPDSQLSAGKRVTATEWQLARRDFDNLVVTLPDQRPDPVRAEISFVGGDGGTIDKVAIAIATAPPDLTPASAAVVEPRKLKPRRKPAIKPAAAVAAEISEKTAAGPGVFLPLLNGPSGTGKPVEGPTAGTEMMINLGVLPR